MQNNVVLSNFPGSGQHSIGRLRLVLLALNGVRRVDGVCVVALLHRARVDVLPRLHEGAVLRPEAVGLRRVLRAVGHLTGLLTVLQHEFFQLSLAYIHIYTQVNCYVGHTIVMIYVSHPHCRVAVVVVKVCSLVGVVLQVEEHVFECAARVHLRAGPLVEIEVVRQHHRVVEPAVVVSVSSEGVE